MKIREMVKLLTDDGWFQIVQKGSHRQFKHKTKLERVTRMDRSGQRNA